MALNWLTAAFDAGAPAPCVVCPPGGVAAAAAAALAAAACWACCKSHGFGRLLIPETVMVCLLARDRFSIFSAAQLQALCLFPSDGISSFPARRSRQSRFLPSPDLPTANISGRFGSPIENLATRAMRTSLFAA